MYGLKRKFRIVFGISKSKDNLIILTVIDIFIIFIF